MSHGRPLNNTNKKLPGHVLQSFAWFPSIGSTSPFQTLWQYGQDAIPARHQWETNQDKSWHVQQRRRICGLQWALWLQWAGNIKVFSLLTPFSLKCLHSNMVSSSLQDGLFDLGPELLSMLWDCQPPLTELTLRQLLVPAFLSLGRTCVNIPISSLTKDLCREK